jgi:hypothetical protein
MGAVYAQLSNNIGHNLDNSIWYILCKYIFISSESHQIAYLALNFG